MGDSPDSSCVSTKAPSLNSSFTLDPPVPSQCSGQTVSWNSSLYPQPPDIRAFIPGGNAFHFTPPASRSATQLAWRVNIREGTQMVLLVQPASLTADTNAITSPLISVTSSQDDTCLKLGSPSSTVKFTSPTAAPGVTNTPTTASTADITPTAASTADTSLIEATTHSENIK